MSAPARRPWGTPIVLAVVAALVAGVALLGGFDTGRARLTRVAPGETFTTGPLELALDRAVARRSEISDGTWDVLVFGRGRTTGDRTLALPLEAVDVKGTGSDVLGDVGFTTESHPAVFNPGVPAFEFALAFTFPDGQVPKGTLLVRVDDLEPDDSFRGRLSSVRPWVPGDTGHLVEVPIAAG